MRQVARRSLVVAAVLLSFLVGSSTFFPASAAAQTRFTIVHTPMEFATRGQPITISASIQPRDSLSYATLFFRRTGNASYRSTFMEYKGGNYEVAIPANEITSYGIEYYISAIDKTGSEQVLFASPETPHYISTKVVAVLITKKVPDYDEVLTGLKSVLKARIDTYDMNGSEDQGRIIVKQVRSSSEPPDLIIAMGKGAALLCKAQVKDIPVVFTMVTNPYKLDLKKDNMTGVSLDVPVKSQLITFKSVVPNIRKVGVIYDPEKTGDMIGQASFIAPSQGFQLITAKTESATDVERALRAFSEGIDAFWLVPDATVVTPLSVKVILEYTIKNRIPLFVFAKTFVEAGALVSLSPDLLDIGKKTADMANKILLGANPETFTIINPEQLKVALNTETARNIGVDKTVAQQVILYAAEKGFPIETVGRR